MAESTPTDGLSDDDREVLEWLRANSDRLAAVAELVLEHGPDSESPPGTADGSTRPSLTPTKRHARSVGESFVWVAYYGDTEDVEQASERIDAAITDLQDDLGEADS